MIVAAAGCASFAGSPPPFTGTPTLTPTIATVVPSGEPAGDATGRAPAGGHNDGNDGSPGTSRSAPTSADPCAPPQAPVIAVCLADPWGLAPLPDGGSALVGERVSGRILRVEAGQQPVAVATVTGLDTRHGGGLLGIALSPYYTEDGLIYAYITTATDARVLRIAAGQQPKAVVTGLPAGGAHPGGSLLFDSDGMLYIATGTPAAGASGAAETATPGTAETAAPGAGAVWRVDEFGKPARNTSGTAQFAAGLDDPTGLCLLPDRRVGVVDHRDTGDVLIALTDGRNYRSLRADDAVWTYAPGDGGAADCALTGQNLIASARTRPHLTSLTLRPGGGFTGEPEALLDREYGLLRTAVTGPGDLVWLTTANRVSGGASGTAHPDPSDDRVVVLPPSEAASGGGGVD